MDSKRLNAPYIRKCALFTHFILNKDLGSCLYWVRKGTMFQSCFFFIMGIVTVTKSLISLASDDNCETFISDIHVTKEEFDDGGILLRTCSDDLSATKCEGFCTSQVQPSIMTATGFLKVCYCCRESYLKERNVILHHCYSPDGIKLVEPETATMEIRLREPADCKCLNCGDFSR